MHYWGKHAVVSAKVLGIQSEASEANNDRWSSDFRLKMLQDSNCCVSLAIRVMLLDVLELDTRSLLLFSWYNVRILSCSRVLSAW